MINVFFTKDKLNTIDCTYRPGETEQVNLIVHNLKELAELDNLTVSILMQFSIWL